MYLTGVQKKAETSTISSTFQILETENEAAVRYFNFVLFSNLSIL